MASGAVTMNMNIIMHIIVNQLLLRTVRAKIKCPKLAVVTQYFCNINSRYYIAYYCVGDRTVRTKKTGQTKGRGVKACYEVQR